MAKYSYNFKRKVVQAYLNGEGSYESIAKQYNIPDKKQVRVWVNAYKEFGDVGLMRSRKNKNYSFQFKLHVVELYLSSEVSYQELALSQGINNPPLITKWVNDFRIAGPDALRPKKKGRKKTLDIKETQKISKINEEKTVDTSAEHIKELEDKIPEIREENKDFGYRRVYGDLKNQGIKVNKKRVQRIMQKLKLQVTSFTRKSRKYSSYKGNVGKIAPNRISRRFNTSIPHQKITTDTTELSIMI